MAKEKHGEWEKESIKNFTKRMNTPTYCQLCGNEIIAYGGALDRYQTEIREEAHLECIRLYQEKQRQEFLAQQNRSQP
jgi:hypothetical protein